MTADTSMLARLTGLDFDSNPLPTFGRVKFAGLQDHLPADAPSMTLAERAVELRKLCAPAAASLGMMR